MVDLIKLQLPPTSTASLSGVAASPDGRWLWVAPDEGRSLIRLQRIEPDCYGNPQEVDVGDIFPQLPKGESDLEGVDLVGNAVWFAGSHSRVRDRVKNPTDERDTLKRLRSVESQPSRQVIGRLGLATDPERNALDAKGWHAFLGPDAAHPLVAELAEDRWLRPFAEVPGKDNGLDVEGLAWWGDTLLLGLRGPVLRGWAVLVALRPEHSDHLERLHLGKAFDGDRYELHFADLRGLGVRDLCRDGDDLLILAGPTMVLDGPFRIHRLTWAATGPLPRVIPADAVPVVEPVTHDLLTADDGVHPEGITVLPDGNHRRLLIVDDNARPDASGKVLCRAFPLPGPDDS